MNKTLVVAIVFLLCALVLGVSGVAVLLGEQATGIEAVTDHAGPMHLGITSFSCNPLTDPGCTPCDPLVDPGCRPPG